MMGALGGASHLFSQHSDLNFLINKPSGVVNDLYTE